MESGDKFLLKKSPLRLPLRKLPLVKMPSPQLLKSHLSQRLLLSSTLSGRTPSNKLDGLNKELPTPKTSLIKLLSTNLGKMAKPDLTNGVLMSSKVV